MSSNVGYLYIWEYLVAPNHISHFEHAYGDSGEWVDLFRRAPGYIRTELHRDLANPQRFITIDYWESHARWEAFRARFAEEYRRLDAHCDEWTISETEIGRFAPVE